MSLERLLHLPWSPLLATAVVLWVVGEPWLAQKSSIFPSAPKTSQFASGERAVEFKPIQNIRTPRSSNYSIGEPVPL